MLEPLKLPSLPQPLKLIMRIEDQGRPGEPPRPARASAVQSHDEESSPRETEGEARILWIGRDHRVPGVDIDIVQPLELLPEQPLKVLFIFWNRADKAGNK